MNRKKASLLIGAVALSLTCLIGCNNKKAKTYTVTWQNYDGTVIEKDENLAKGVVPTFDSNTPIRDDDAHNYYIFKGWDKEIEAVKGDATYIAQYDSYALFDVAETPNSYIDALPANNDDGNILHAFCWPFNKIKENLPYIEEAGFKIIQTSPVQTPKSSGASWWAYYQPLGFQIAEKSPLGTKQELEALCAEAHKYNISIIVDAVFNHLANVDDGVLEEDGTPSVSEKVKDYEEYIYEHRNDADNPTFHHNPKATDAGSETQYYPDLPDLNTANPKVQERALAFLKECIDVGVDGFRFDAAKHIETPETQNYASNFWPNTLGVAKTYYKEKTGKTLFAYGEILGSPSGCSIDAYTKYMKVCDDSYGSMVYSSVFSEKAAKVPSFAYGKGGIDPNNLVGWLESHDDFTTVSKPYPNSDVVKGWATISSRKGYRSLFLARTDEAFSVGIVHDYLFEEEIVAVSNRFHNRFVNANEQQSSDGSIYINERYSETDKGAVVVNYGNDKHIQVNFKQLGSIVLYDQLTGKKVISHNGHATIDLDDSGIAVLTLTPNKPRPIVSIDDRTNPVLGEKDVKVNVKNAETATYQINNGEAVTFTGEKTINLKGEDAVDGVIKLTIVASNSQFSRTQVYTYKVINLIKGYFNVINIDPSYFENYNVYMWSWAVGALGYWNQNYTIQDGVLLVDAESLNLKGFLLALFDKTYEPVNINKWDDNVLKQTVDITGSLLDLGYYDASNW